MASSRTLFCDEFHCSAGSVLFRFDRDELEICILHNRRTGEFVLPKGHKDLGESIEQAAVRETYEETGWSCDFYPTDIITRVPPAGVSSGEHAREAIASTREAIAVTLRDVDKVGHNAKLIFWFITQITGTAKHQNTQMATEELDSMFLEAQLAINTLSRPGDKEVAERAVQLVTKTREGLSKQ